MVQSEKYTLGDFKYVLMRIKDYCLDENFEYEDITNLLEDLDDKEKKNVKINLLDVEKNVLNFWRDLNLKKTKSLIKIITNKKSKCVGFAKIQRELEQIEKDVDECVENKRHLTLKMTYEDTLLNLDADIYEKIDDEKLKRKRARDDIVFGWILGIIGAYILPVIFDFVKSYFNI